MLKVILFIVLNATLSLAAGCYSIKQYHGDGEISHPNRFWRPKYVVNFSEIDLSRPGHYSFAFRGVPPTDLTFAFDTSVPEQEWRRLGAEHGIHIRTVLEDDDGHVLFDEGAELAQEHNEGWIISDPPPNSIYRPRMCERRLEGDQQYHWQIWVKTDRPGERPLLVRPTMGGGGNLAL